LTDIAGKQDIRPARRIAGSRIAAIFLCGIVGLYFAAIAGYALAHATEFATDTPRLIRYVFAPLGLTAFFAICAFALPAAVGRDIGMVATSILAALFLFETVLTIRSFPSELGLAGHDASGGSTAQYRAGLPPIYTLKALNVRLGATSPSETMLGGVPGAEVLLCSHNGAPVRYTADRYGFRNPDRLRDGQVDLLVLGDSFTEGICLEDGKDFVSRLREKVPMTFGAGTRGAGPFYELAVLGRYGPVFRPKHTVIAFFGGNDWENLGHEKDLPYLVPALDEQTDFGPVIPDDATVTRARAILEGVWDESSRSAGAVFSSKKIIRNFLALQQTSLVLGLHYPKASKDEPVFDKILDRARAMAEGWQGEVLIAYIPPVDRFIGILDSGFVHDELRDTVRASAAQADIGFIDLTEVFLREAEDPSALYAGDAHFNERGAELAARAIAEALDTE